MSKDEVTDIQEFMEVIGLTKERIKNLRKVNKEKNSIKRR